MWSQLCLPRSSAFTERCGENWARLREREQELAEGVVFLEMLRIVDAEVHALVPVVGVDCDARGLPSQGERVSATVDLARRAPWNAPRVRRAAGTVTESVESRKRTMSPASVVPCDT